VCEIGWPDSWRERKVDVSIGQNMRKVFTQENSRSRAFVNVNFNGDLKFSGTFKIRGFDTF
jgi:hypothetical protein